MLFTDPSLVEKFTDELADVNRRMNQLEARRLFLLRKLDHAEVARSSGARSMVDWTSTNLDLAPDTARELTAAARNLIPTDPWLFEEMENGNMSFDRATATVRLMNTHAPEDVIDRSFAMELARVSRLASRYRRTSVKDESQVFKDRYLSIQPTLDNSRWVGHFELPAVEGSIVDRAITERADELRRQPGGDYFTRYQLQSDALVMIAQDSLGADTSTGSPGLMEASSLILTVPKTRVVSWASNSNTARESGRACCGKSSAAVLRRWSDSERASRSSPPNPPLRYLRRCAASWRGGTRDARFPAVPAATGFNPIT